MEGGPYAMKHRDGLGSRLNADLTVEQISQLAVNNQRLRQISVLFQGLHQSTMAAFMQGIYRARPSERPDRGGQIACGDGHLSQLLQCGQAVPFALFACSKSPRLLIVFEKRAAVKLDSLS
jgi:hypothetical protein